MTLPPADGQDKVHALFSAQRNALVHLGEPGIRLHAAQLRIADAQFVQLGLHILQQPQANGCAAVMEQHFRAAEFPDQRAGPGLRAAPKEDFCWRIVFKIDHRFAPSQFSLSKGAPHSGQNFGVSPGSGV